MRDYKNYNRRPTGYKSSPEIVFIAMILAYLVAGLSWEQIATYFGF